MSENVCMYTHLCNGGLLVSPISPGQSVGVCVSSVFKAVRRGGTGGGDGDSD